MNSAKIDKIDQSVAIASLIDYIKMIHNAFAPPVYRLLTEHGQPWYIGEQTFAGPRSEPGACYRNAYLAVQSNPTLTYVEGLCHMGIIPIEHAWCIDRDGRVVEPTLPEASGYYGIPFQWNYVQATALKTKFYGVLSLTNRDLLSGKVPVYEFLEER
jgi:hypothetical protein